MSAHLGEKGAVRHLHPMVPQLLAAWPLPQRRRQRAKVGPAGWAGGGASPW